MTVPTASGSTDPLTLAEIVGVWADAAAATHHAAAASAHAANARNEGTILIARRAILGGCSRSIMHAAWRERQNAGVGPRLFA